MVEKLEIYFRLHISTFLCISAFLKYLLDTFLSSQYAFLLFGSTKHALIFPSLSHILHSTFYIYINPNPYNFALPLELAVAPLSSSTIPLAIPLEIPIVVIIGLTPLAEGNTLASATYNPCVPQTLPRGSTTLFFGLVPIRHEPIWCADAKPVSGEGRPVVRI